MPGRASVIKGRRLGTRSKLAEITVRSEQPTLSGKRGCRNHSRLGSTSHTIDVPTNPLACSAEMNIAGGALHVCTKNDGASVSQSTLGRRLRSGIPIRPKGSIAFVTRRSEQEFSPALPENYLWVIPRLTFLRFEPFCRRTSNKYDFRNDNYWDCGPLEWHRHKLFCRARERGCDPHPAGHTTVKIASFRATVLWHRLGVAISLPIDTIKGAQCALWKQSRRRRWSGHRSCGPS